MVYLTLSENEIVETLNKTESKMLLVLDVALDSICLIKNKIRVPIIVLSVSDSMPTGMRLLYRFKAKTKLRSFISFQTFLQHSIGKDPAPISSVHDKPAIIIYTSGTTGEPKGVELSNDNINAVAWQYGFVDVSISRGDTILVFMPPFLSIGICYLHMPLCKGIELIICAIVLSILTENGSFKLAAHIVWSKPLNEKEKAECLSALNKTVEESFPEGIRIAAYAEHDGMLPFSPTTLKKDKNKMAKQTTGYMQAADG